MAIERAHPEAFAFKRSFKFVLRRGFIPWIRRGRTPYRDALFWRYGVVARHCKGKRVLDIPCGMGWGTSLLKGCRFLVGVDISAEAVREARLKYNDKAEFIVGSMADLCFDDESFDAIACLEGIEHVPEEIGRRFIQESARLLKPSGMLFVSSPHCPAKKHSGNPYHIKEYTPDEMEALLKPYYDIVEVTSRNVDVLIVNLFRGKRRN